MSSANPQKPTLANVWVRSARDAMLIFNAVANRVAPKVERRLDENERSLIQSGNVYVWEERGAQIDSTGLSMERWTDGLHWGPSRAREFLYYQQIIDDGNGPSSSKRRRTVRNTPLTTAPAAGTSASGRAVPLLTKQTFSANVTLPHENGLVRKWHMTAYFAGEHVEELRSVEAVPGVGDKPLPDGVFVSARASTRSASTRRNSMTARSAALPPLQPSTSAPLAPSTASAEAGPSSATQTAGGPPESIPRPVTVEQPISRLGPIPPLPSSASTSAPTHFPRSAAWDPYVPASPGGDALASFLSPIGTHGLTSATSSSASATILTPTTSTASSGAKDKRTCPESDDDLPPTSALSIGSTSQLPVANTPYGNTVTANNPVIVANRTRHIHADPQNLANVAVAAERPILKLAPLAYLEGLEGARRRRDPGDERTLRSFQRATPRRWARSGS